MPSGSDVNFEELLFQSKNLTSKIPASADDGSFRKKLRRAFAQVSVFLSLSSCKFVHCTKL